MPSSEDQLSEAFGLVETGPHRYEAGNVGDTAIRDVVYGGQLLGQMILAASRSIPDKEVKSIHAIFARGGTLTRPVELDVEPMHDGRTLASTTVTRAKGTACAPAVSCCSTSTSPTSSVTVRTCRW